ncbi:hypothetical protein TNCV_1956031 [Trichonephila clavipes]|nr:hypothetical protein TNCV_1956031 [Trichonephila clavipes]
MLRKLQLRPRPNSVDFPVAESRLCSCYFRCLPLKGDKASELQCGDWYSSINKVLKWIPAPEECTRSARVEECQKFDPSTAEDPPGRRSRGMLNLSRIKRPPVRENCNLALNGAPCDDPSRAPIAWSAPMVFTSTNPGRFNDEY